ncbi:MAG: HAMP domain-containing protein [Kofleriaceae bacterium]|nr:HAMP domain-containing protein [Kofleriaceae bacterium]
MMLFYRVALYMSLALGISVVATHWLGLLGLAVALVAALGAAALIVMPMVRRLRELEQGTTRLRSGELGARVDDEGSDAIASLGAGINHMATELERVLDQQTQLLQAVSHEFRTPIARLRFAVEMFLSDKTQKEREERARSIDENLTELDALVEEILTYGKLDNKSAVFQTESIEVGQEVRNIVASTEDLRGKVEVTIDDHGQPEATIIAYHRNFTRVVENLVLNAIRHANDRVRVEYQTVNDVVLILVHDDGRGVPKADRDRVWEPFARLDQSRSRDTGGFGLGLAIVRRIMAWHGGAAHVEKSLLGGAMFVTSWPIEGAAHEG